MASTQYIGARYVPLIDGEWDDTKIYEPLTIVTYLNASYTSKQPVPAGVPITDTDYWVLTGNYNGFIQTVNNKVDALSDRVDTVVEYNYQTPAEFTGSTDTEILQNAIDGCDFLVLDRDYTITSVWIRKPIVFNLGGHKITSSTNDDNTINIASSNVAIFNGEIYTTEADISNEHWFGSCIYVRASEDNGFEFGNLKLHDLKLSSNASQTVVLLGEVFNTIVENCIFNGARSNPHPSINAINIEWKHINPSYHPHDIVLRNCSIYNYHVGVRTAAAFNCIFENIYIDESNQGVSITAGDNAADNALAKYKAHVNRNISIKNVAGHNVTVGISLWGISGHTNGEISANVENCRFDADAANNGTGILTNEPYMSHIANCIITGPYLNGMIIRGSDNSVENNFVTGSMNNLINNQGVDSFISNNRVYNGNQAQTSGTTGAAILSSGNRARIVNNIVAGGSAYETFTIRNSGNNSIITNNITFGAVTDVSTGSIVDNNKEI